MTNYPPETTPKEVPVPLRPIPQVPLCPMSQIPLGPNPCMVTCPFCRASIRTNVTLKAGTHTHLIALLLCLICVCCAWIPYVVDSCQNAEHYCPNCHAFLGTYKK